ncbi:unnamed protein product [Larinioides sclopetarius]|uniref:Uncharacterized protein n=1 Tax=Larinioides sclopetarius TaxID=280406 RepID=A0AAV1ZLH4_9ARAC
MLQKTVHENGNKQMKNNKATHELMEVQILVIVSTEVSLKVKKYQWTSAFQSVQETEFLYLLFETFGPPYRE